MANTLYTSEKLLTDVMNSTMEVFANFLNRKSNAAVFKSADLSLNNETCVVDL